MKKAIVITKIRVPYNGEFRYFYFNNKKQLLQVGSGFSYLRIKDYLIAARNSWKHPRAQIDYQVWIGTKRFPFIETKAEATELANKINRLQLFTRDQ